MEFSFHQLAESLFRWIHVVAGITWIGLLYFFNWVNAVFAPTMDADTKKKVVPELMPRALWWFRWGAAYTWVSGVILLVMVYYRYNAHLDDPLGETTWGILQILMIAITFLAVVAYDRLVAGPVKDPRAIFWGGWIAISLVYLLMLEVGEFSYRGALIHVGALFGTNMAFNVWMRIWPAQQRIITAIKNGQAPDGGDVALAGTRSKHNTYMSIPLVFAMIGQHATWAASGWYYVSIVILVGWAVCYMLYQKSKTVKGF